MTEIKLEDLYLSKEKLKDIIQLVAKKRNIKCCKSKSNDRLYKILKNNLKIREE